MGDKLVIQDRLGKDINLTVFSSNSTKSIAIVGTSAIITLRNAFATDKSMLFSVKDISQSVFFVMETNGFSSASNVKSIKKVFYEKHDKRF
jgi:hypothetical protein